MAPPRLRVGPERGPAVLGVLVAALLLTALATHLRLVRPAATVRRARR